MSVVTFNRDEYERHIAFREKERMQREAAEREISERRRQRYEAVYAATFARLRGWPTRASVENAQWFARVDALSAAREVE